MARDVRANAMRVISRVVSSILLVLSIRTPVRVFSGLACPDERNICGRLPYVKPKQGFFGNDLVTISMVCCVDKSTIQEAFG